MDISYTKENPIRCFFAFEGYNSQGMALERLKQTYPSFDWICAGRSEIDKYAIMAANAVFPESKDKNFGNISKIEWKDVPDFDLFTYSFPCTDISSAGKQKGLEENSGTRSSLLWECKKAIEIKRPEFLLMENVKALTQKKFLPYLREWQLWLESKGYSNYKKYLMQRITECLKTEKEFLWYRFCIKHTMNFRALSSLKKDLKTYWKQKPVRNIFFRKDLFKPC